MLSIFISCIVVLVFEITISIRCNRVLRGGIYEKESIHMNRTIRLRKYPFNRKMAWMKISSLEVSFSERLTSDWIWSAKAIVTKRVPVRRDVQRRLAGSGRFGSDGLVGCRSLHSFDPGPPEAATRPGLRPSGSTTRVWKARPLDGTFDDRTGSFLDARYRRRRGRIPQPVRDESVTGSLRQRYADFASMNVGFSYSNLIDVVAENVFQRHVLAIIGCWWNSTVVWWMEINLLVFVE